VHAVPAEVIKPFMRNRYSRADIFFIWALAIVLFAVIFFPFYWIIVTSFKKTFEIYAVPPQLIPASIDLSNYVSAFMNYNVGRFFVNSLYVTVVTVFFTTTISMCAAYALTRMEFRGKHKIRALLGVTQMFPVVVILVPLFIFAVALNLYDSLYSIVPPYVALQIPVSIILQSSYFIDVPKEMEEAAFMEGCSLFQAFVHVFLPLVIPGITAVSVYTFIQVWQEFLIASSFITSPRSFPLTVGLTTFRGEFATDWGALMATSVLIAVPALVLFTLTQSFFISRIAGGVKE
jgi:ABC-type glycerol-3-phosphate transport system permease component